MKYLKLLEKTIYCVFFFAFIVGTYDFFTDFQIRNSILELSIYRNSFLYDTAFYDWFYMGGAFFSLLFKQNDTSFIIGQLFTFGIFCLSNFVFFYLLKKSYIINICINKKLRAKR